MLALLGRADVKQNTRIGVHSPCVRSRPLTPSKSLSRFCILVFQQPKGQPGLQVYLPRSASPSTSLPPSSDTINNSEYTTPGEWAWYDAPVPPPSRFLVNVGLAMESWSGGAYKATLHRVIFPEPKDGEGALKDRYTFAYFVQPDDDVVC